ncbi:MAG: hypothetical protein PVS3B3_23460 [Ktedonobacteraceae bacterium]
MAIVNGRRIQVPPQGITGHNLIQHVNPGTGRRPVIQQGGTFQTIRPSSTYKPTDLYDKHGNPVKITTIPDRTKGVVYGGDRTSFSKQIITEQVYDIAQKLFKQGVSFDEEHADWMIANDYVLPPIWHSIARTTDLLIIFPTEYPEVPPVGFYLKEDIPLSVNGHLYQTAYHEACSDPLTQGWKWYCVYINAGAWQPAPIQRPGDWRTGDNLWTYFTLISEVLSGTDD